MMEKADIGRISCHRTLDQRSCKAELSSYLGSEKVDMQTCTLVWIFDTRAKTFTDRYRGTLFCIMSPHVRH